MFTIMLSLSLTGNGIFEFESNKDCEFDKNECFPTFATYFLK